MLVNVPKKIQKRDIKYLGYIFPAGHGYYLMDMYNTKHKLKLGCMSGCNYVYDVLDTYLFITGQFKFTNKHYEDVVLKQKDFIRYIFDFEYKIEQGKFDKLNFTNLHEQTLKNMAKLNIPSGKFLFTSKQRWLRGSILRDIEKDIDCILQTEKTYLRGIQRPQKRRFECLCDNWNGIGVFEYGFAKKMLLDKYVCVQKCTELDGFIIKYEHSGFDC